MALIERYSGSAEGCGNYQDQNILENKEFSRKQKLKIIKNKSEDSGANTKGGLEN